MIAWERQEKSEQKGDLSRARIYVKSEAGEGRRDKQVSKNYTYPILDHGNLVNPTGRGEPLGEPNYGLDPAPVSFCLHVYPG